MEDSDRSSTSQNLLESVASMLKSKIYKTVTFKDLSFDQYRFLLFVSLIVNLVFLSLQVGRFGYLVEQHDLGGDKGLTLVILAFILTTINSGLLLKLMVSPTPRAAVCSMGIILVQEGIFIAQTAIYYGIAAGEAYIVALSIIFLFLQLISVVVVYRFWEFILFNFDSDSWAGGTPSTGNLSDINMEGSSSFAIGRNSTGGIHPSKVRSPLTNSSSSNNV